MAIKMQEEYGSDLQVIFVEVQGASRNALVSALIDRKWMSGSAIWTTERVFSTGMSGIPNYALLDANGAVVMSGYSNRSGKAAEKKIAELIKLRKNGRKDIPSLIAKVEVDINKGNYGKALRKATELQAKPGRKDTEAVLAGAKDMEARVRRELSASFTRFDWMIANGYPFEAKELFDQLESQLGKMPDYAENLSTMDVALASSEHKVAIKAARELAKIRKSISEDGRDKKLQKQLLRLAEKHAGTAVATRASFLASRM
jgi:hypothetical protein